MKTAIAIALLTFFAMAVGSVVATQEVESNDSMSLADYVGSVPGTCSISAAKSPVGDVDWFYFYVSQYSYVEIETTGASGGDTEIYLYDSSGNQLDYDDDSGSGYYSYIDTYLSSGYYYVKVEEYANNEVISWYTLTITGTAAGGGVGAVEVELSPSSTTVSRGSTFTVSIYVDPGSCGISSGEVWVSFDTSAFTATDASAGSLLGSGPVEALKQLDNNNGLVKLAYARVGSTPVPTSTGVFATITFTVKNSASAGTYAINIQYAGFADQNFNDIANVVSYSTYVTVTAGLTGDINGDGVVNYVDLAILGAAYGSTSGSPNYNASADLNGDGTINYVDLAILGAHYGESL